ncbi:unnamed protein product, partial [Didymodactylos carnosus]
MDIGAKNMGDYLLLRPVTIGYKHLTNAYTKARVSSFIDNISTPVTIVNYGLQGNYTQTMKSVWRFLINTTFGIGGLFDVASKMGLTVTPQSFGSTLANYGVGPGPYLVLPFLGGTNARDITDSVFTNTYFNPIMHMVEVMRKITLYLIFLCSIPALVYAADIVDKYVDQLVKDGLTILNDNTISQETKVTKTKKLILANLDLPWMAKVTLGGYRKTLTPEQVSKFTEAYSHYVSKAYASLVKNYHGQEPKILEVNSVSKGEFMVSMLIETIKGPIKVKYLVRKVNETDSHANFKVSDIITE